MNINITLPSTFLADVDGPTDADLAAEAAEAPVAETVEDWAALLDAEVGTVEVKKFDEDFWNEDENVHDDRYDNGIPSWSAWA